MNKEKPLFSVILPTYNRAARLSLAIKSVLQQTFKDFELVVCNSASPDNTREVVAEFDDPRLRYVEPETRLSMGENYEYALNHATGQFIIFFSDDDAFIPTMLEKLEKIISEHQDAKMIIFPFAYYYQRSQDGSLDDENRNRLSISPFTGKLRQVDSETDIRRMFATYGLIDEKAVGSEIKPLIGNVVCHYSVIEQLKTKIPELFATVPVDIYFITLVLAVIDKYYVYDAPLLVWSEWESNSGIYMSKTDSLRRHYEKLLDGKTLDEVPLKFVLPLNCTANAILQAKREIGDKLDFIEVDWKAYFVNVFRYLLYLEAEEINVREELKEFHRVLSEQPPELQNQVRNETTRSMFFLKQTVKKKFPFVNKMIKDRAEQKSLNAADKIIIAGDEAGFDNVLESANYLATLLK